MKELLISAKLEIDSLRRQNEFLKAQMYVVQVFAAALGFRSDNPPMTVDVAWQLEREIEKMAQETKRPRDTGACDAEPH